jgi:hypothetical protein
MPNLHIVSHVFLCVRGLLGREWVFHILVPDLLIERRGDFHLHEMISGSNNVGLYSGGVWFEKPNCGTNV